MKVVIVGGVAGGASCAARLRRLDETAEIIILERGEYISYANCGLPYHVGGVIPSRGALLLQTPAEMEKKFRVDVRVRSEAVKIDRERKEVTVKRLPEGNTYRESYDVLVLATGSSPVRPPIPGAESDRVKTLWTVPDTDGIRAFIKEKNARGAVIVGGGFIGLEMAENLHRLGLHVSLVEMLDQVMPPMDPEMAKLVEENMRENGVQLHLGDGVASLTEENGGVTVRLKSGKSISADMAVLAVGVRPNGELAKAAGLKVNARGGVVVDSYLRTSDPAIYAVGDVIETADLVFASPAMVPLAGPANKQGRIAADNIAGGREIYEGTQGTAVAKVFDLTAASTGANEKTLISRGLKRGTDYETVTITQNSHAAYYPGAELMTLKLLFSMDGKKLFGAQIVGRGGVDKRIDTLAAAIRLGAGVKELRELELGYAPPYSSAKDPVNMLGFCAQNVLSGLARFASWDAPDREKDALLLDVREREERAEYAVPGSVNIPLGSLRGALDGLDRERPVIVLCAIGVRAYNAARILSQNGFGDVRVYPGGSRFYRSTHSENAPGVFSGEGLESACVDCGGKPRPGLL